MDLAASIADLCGGVEHGNEIVNRLFDAMKRGLEEGKTIELRSFGVFKVKHMLPRMGRNPKTGASVPIPARHKVTFKFAGNI